MRQRALTRGVVLAAFAVLFVFAMSATALAATVSQTPNFNSGSIAAGSSYTISWTSSGLAAGETLTLHFVDMPLGVSDVAIASGLAQNGSYTVTLPAGTIGSKYCYYLVSSGGTYSDAALTPWSFTLSSGSGPPGPGTITQTPNFNGTTLPAGSPYVIHWTSTGLPGAATLVLHDTDMPLGVNDVVVASGLPQSGSFTATVPSGPVGSNYCFYLVSNATSPATYSNAALAPWSFTIGPAATNTPASSRWSLALLGLVGLGIAGISLSRPHVREVDRG